MSPPSKPAAVDPPALDLAVGGTLEALELLLVADRACSLGTSLALPTAV